MGFRLNIISVEYPFLAGRIPDRFKSGTEKSNGKTKGPRSCFVGLTDFEIDH